MVYARHGHDFMGWKSPLRDWGTRGSSVYQETAPVDKVRGGGNFGRATDRGEEAGACAARRRPETSSNLKVPRRQVIRYVRCRKGPWHMAKTIASGVGLTNHWLASPGLHCLKALWAHRTRLRRTARYRHRNNLTQITVRTRMLVGVEGAVRNGCAYPIYPVS